MQPMTPTRQAAARKMLSETEQGQIACLLQDVEQLVTRKLTLGLSGEAVGAIAATVRLALREEIDAAVYHSRTTDFLGLPPI